MFILVGGEGWSDHGGKMSELPIQIVEHYSHSSRLNARTLRELAHERDSE